MAGIVGYGCYVPKYRIKSSEIARVWGEDAKRIEEGLGIKEKAVAGVDEDTTTIAYEAGRNALKRAGINPKEIGAIYIGSESHPYAVKTTSSIVGEALGVSPNFTAADLEFACKAGTAAIQMNMGLVDAGYVKYGFAIGADTAQGKPGDALEYSAASGGAGFIVGNNDESLALLKATYSFTTDTPDFWRRAKADYPSHAARFTGEPAYFRHVINATLGLLEKYDYKLEEFDYVVFHQPNAKFPLRAAKKLGIPFEKIKDGLVVPYIGNTYSGSSLLGLCSVLDKAKEGELILLTSFGSGAGSDSFVLETTSLLEEKRDRAPLLKDYVENKEYIDYATYAKLRGKLKGFYDSH